jgi:hypothetical protein
MNGTGIDAHRLKKSRFVAPASFRNSMAGVNSRRCGFRLRSFKEE